MQHLYFPLRWESTGQQWWYASPIDCAAASGHYDLVKELLRLDANLLIKLTSLRRIRRLETVWDDESQFSDVAKCRSGVARELFMDCKGNDGQNSLIQAGYGGWLFYTAASAGDLGFVKDLLERDPLLVFGEGEYGVTDMLFAAARSKSLEVFKFLLDFAISMESGPGNDGEGKWKYGEACSGFRLEMMNRAVHAAARAGNLEALKELLGDCSDVLAYRDVDGSTILHSAAGRGQVVVVKELVAAYGLVNFKDNGGNTALHVAAYRGYSPVVEVMVAASPSLISVTNNEGDTFLHLAVAGFRAPGFHRMDQQIDLLRQLLKGEVADVQGIINATNNAGRTALHIALIDTISTNVVELLMTAPAIALNILDSNGMTPLDLLRQWPKTASSEMLMKQLVSAGATSSHEGHKASGAVAARFKTHDLGHSPGTSFRIPDAEMFLSAYSDRNSAASCDSDTWSARLSDVDSANKINSVDSKKFGSMRSAAIRLKSLLQWPNKMVKITTKSDCCRSLLIENSWHYTPIPLRERFSVNPSLSTSRRVLRVKSVSCELAAPSTRKKLMGSPIQGLIQGTLLGCSQSSSFCQSPVSSSTRMDKVPKRYDNDKSSVSSNSFDGKPMYRRHRSFRRRFMDHYLCFGAEGLGV